MIVWNYFFKAVFIFILYKALRLDRNIKVLRKLTKWLKIFSEDYEPGVGTRQAIGGRGLNFENKNILGPQL